MNRTSRQAANNPEASIIFAETVSPQEATALVDATPADDGIEFIEADSVDPLDVDDQRVDASVRAPAGIACPNCACPNEATDRFCPACGTANQHFVGTSTRASAEQLEESSQKHFRCEGCGSEISADPDTRSYTCPFCDSTFVVEFSPDYSGRQRPEFVIGFAVEPHQATELFRAWIKNNSWFHPGDLDQATLEEKLKGVYLPFWSFSMLAESDWSAQIGEYWYRTETYTTTENGKTVTKTRRVRETEWWPLRGKHHRYYSGYLVSGSQRVSQQEADQIKPFQLPALKRYEPFYLAGWLSEEYSIEKEVALQISKQEFVRREKQNIHAFLPGDTSRVEAASTRFSQIQSDLCLLPIFLATYRYKDRTFRFMVNGQTGRVAGRKPVSKSKIGIAVGAGVGLLLLIILLFVVLLGIASG